MVGSFGNKLFIIIQTKFGMTILFQKNLRYLLDLKSYLIFLLWYILTIKHNTCHVIGVRTDAKFTVSVLGVTMTAIEFVTFPKRRSLKIT